MVNRNPNLKDEKAADSSIGPAKMAVDDVVEEGSYTTPAPPLRDRLRDLMKFRYSDLRKATRDFSDDLILGRGEIGTSYLGWFDQNFTSPAADSSDDEGAVAVAVTRHDDSIMSPLDPQKFMVEVDCMQRLEHPHLVKLIGYCAENPHLLLVYEHMSMGSVLQHLSYRVPFDEGCQGDHPFSWDLRLKVALQVAHGLEFLHHQADMIHGDIRTDYILLDQNFNAKLSNIGLVKARPDDECFDYTRPILQGNSVYAASDYICAGYMTKKSDVYSFGVVLLEMLLGVKPLWGIEGMSLVEFAETHLKRPNKQTLRLADNMGCRYNPSGAYRLARLISMCLEDDPGLRPSMNEIVRELEFINEHDLISEMTKATREIKFSGRARRWTKSLSSLLHPARPYNQLFSD